MRAFCISCAALTFATLAGCEVSENPADGGFVSGVSGLSQGTYQERIDTRNAAIAEETERQRQLQAELGQLESEYASLQRQILSQRSQAAAKGVAVPADLDAKAQALIAGRPGGATDAARLANYRQAVADARKVTAGLAGL